LNIWTCNISNDILGYAQFPGGAAATDGVVLHYKYTGKTGATAPFNKGRTGTHEVGHWLGLYHTFQGGCAGTSSTNCNSGGDQVCDTPPTSAARYGCPSVSTIHNTCTETPTDYRDMTMNYMDYVDDGCMNLFTLGQKARMVAVMNGVRASLKTSNGCVPVPVFTNDAGIKSIKSPENGICANTVNPVVVLKNYSNSTLTNTVINYKVGNNGSVNSQNWAGSLTANGETNVTLGTVTLNSGDTIFAFTTLPNGNADEKTSNDIANRKIEIINTSQNPPLAYAFQNTTLPAGWSIVDVDNDGRTWGRIGSIGYSGNNSLRFNNYSGPDLRGTRDHFITPNVNFIGTDDKATLSFFVAYAPYSTQFNDSLEISASTNCGETWSVIYKKGGSTLQTANATTNNFNPGSTASNWRRDTIDVSSFIGSDDIRFRWTNINGYGNNMYIDDINIYTYRITGLAKNSLVNNGKFEIYPNPATNVLMIANKTFVKSDITIHNILGEVVIQKTLTNELSEIDINNLKSGSYIITIHSDNEINKFKFTKN
jgi:hypothetical protein